MNSKKGLTYRLKLSENMIKQGYKVFDEDSYREFNSNQEFFNWF